MNRPIDDYKYLKDLDNVYDVAYFTLFEKYMQYKLRGEDKVIEIDDTDQESIMLAKTGGFPIPGNVYTFIYKGALDSIKVPKQDPKKYMDLVPLLFCMDFKPGKSFSGLNLNLLPPLARLQFLESFYETFQDFLEKEVDVLAENDKLALNHRFLDYIMSDNTQKMIKLFSRKNNENFKFAWRSYSMPKVGQLRMIEYAEWKYIPFYEPKAAFRKLSQNQIYKLYGRTKQDI
jgi:hypothetical protein